MFEKIDKMERKFGVATKAIIKNKEGKYLVLFKSSTKEDYPKWIKDEFKSLR